MANQLPGQSAKTTQGLIHQVPCPHCGKPNNFGVLKSQQLLDTGHCVFCDYCGHSMEVVKIATVELVAVRRDPSGKVRPQGQRGRQIQGRGQQQIQKPGLLQRLLGKG
jgi:hypothetical protein